jgi:hypothetical protein
MEANDVNNDTADRTVSEAVDRQATLEQVVAAARKTLRTKADAELVNEGIDLMFDAGIVATCRRCRLSWRVSRSRFQQLEWWACPSSCNRYALSHGTAD